MKFPTEMSRRELEDEVRGLRVALDSKISAVTISKGDLVLCTIAKQDISQAETNAVVEALKGRIHTNYLVVCPYNYDITAIDKDSPFLFNLRKEDSK